MTLVTHCGARQVTWGELDLIPTQPPTETWFPLSHSQVLGSVVETLDAFTEVIKDRQQRQPSRAAHEMITLQKLIGGAYGVPVQAA